MRGELGDLGVPDAGDLDDRVDLLNLRDALAHENDQEAQVGDVNPNRYTCNLHQAWRRDCGCEVQT